MMNKDIIGGVSPLKKSAYSARGYTGRTRFKPSEDWKPPASGGTSYYGSPKIEKVIQQGKSKADKPATATATAGSTSTGPSGYWEDVYGDVTTTEDLPGYRKVWDANKDDLQGKYEGDFDKWVKAADKWWEDEAEKAGMSVEEFKSGYRKTKTERKYLGQRFVPTSGGTSTSYATSHATGGS
jgi:hypothetical protein